jgi:hypothetical protein
MGISMSKKASQEAGAKPIISEYDQYYGVYDREGMTLKTESGAIALDRCPIWLIDGQTVLLGGECEYPCQKSSQDCNRVPSRMVIKTCYPQ